jgi:FMN-dependent NADH-azoreductase
VNILHIDSSIQGEHSVSRQLSSAIVAQLLAMAPNSTVGYHDLARDPLPQFSAEVVQALQRAAVEASSTEIQEAYVVGQAVDQVIAADIVVIGAPMYNFSVPSQLKSWLDAIAVPGKTFSYGPEGVHGLLGGTRVIIASARGGIYSPGSPAASAEHHESYLRAFFGFLGVTKFEVIRAEGMRTGEDVAAEALSQALAQVAKLEAA